MPTNSSSYVYTSIHKVHKMRAEINKCIYVRKTIYLCQYRQSKDSCHECKGTCWVMSSSPTDKIYRTCVLTSEDYTCEGYYNGEFLKAKFKKIRDFSLIF